MITPSQENIFRTKGVVRIPKVFSLEEIDRLRADAFIALSKSPHLEVINNYPTIMYYPDIEVPQPILDIAEQLLGDGYRQLNKQVYFHLPGDSDEFGWHRDYRFWEDIKDYVQTAVIIDEWTKENGAVEFVDERDIDDNLELRVFDRDRYKGKQMLAKPGDVLLWSYKVVHGSERNKTRYPRMYFMNGFGK